MLLGGETNKCDHVVEFTIRWQAAALDPRANRMTQPPPPQRAQRKQRSAGSRLTRWFAWVFGPSVIVGAAVWFLLRDRAEGNKPLIVALVAAILFAFLWQWLRMRLTKTGRGMAYAMRSMFLALLFVGAVVAATYFFWIR